MKELKAYIHRSRVAEVIAALKESKAWGGVPGDARHNLAVYLVKGMVPSPQGTDKHYSTDLGDEVVNEYKLELLCADAELDDLIQTIQTSAHIAGGGGSGWITVTELSQAIRLR